MSEYRFECVVKSTHIAESKEKHTPSVFLELEVVKDSLSGTPVDQLDESFPRTLTHNLWLTDASVERTFQTLRDVLGWQGGSFDELDEGTVLAGVHVDVSWSYDQYQGKNFPKVEWINRPGEMRRREPVSPAIVQSLTAKYARLLHPAAASKPAQSAAPAQRQATRPATRPAATSPASVPGMAPQDAPTYAGPDDCPF